VYLYEILNTKRLATKLIYVNDVPFSVCGEGKAKKDLANQKAPPSKKKRSPQEEKKTAINPADDDDNLEFFSYSTNDSAINCGSTIVNDRFIIFAAHCQSQFQK